MKKAVIIKGNPLYIDGNIKADALYSNIENILKSKGYSVQFDQGLPMTRPDVTANLWVGHSRGADRLRFAPPGIHTLEIYTKSKDGDDPLHYELSLADLARLNNLK